jgi:predicted neuraminidase
MREFRHPNIWAVVFFALVTGSAASAQIFTSSNVSAEATMPVQHGSSVIELDDGSLLVSWYAGRTAAARDTRILLRRSTTGGASWEPTQTVVVPGECAAESWFSNKTLGNTTLFQDTEKVVWLFYAAVEFGGWSGAHIEYKTSRDRGRTWSEAHRLTGKLGDLPRSKPIELGSDDIFLPLSHSALRKYCGGIRLEISDGKITKKLRSTIAGKEYSHPTFVAIDSNRVLAFLRARRRDGSVQSASFDVSKNTWSSPQITNLRNPNSAIDAVRFAGGRILLAYNDSATYRNPLSIAMSDDGVNFRKLRDVENESGQEFFYPSLIRARDGTFYLTYTWHYCAVIKCIHFDARWLGLNLDSAVAGDGAHLVVRIQGQGNRYTNKK